MARALTIAGTAVETPMGAQAYEHAIRSRARAALADAPEQWVVHDVVARSLRSPRPVPSVKLDQAAVTTPRSGCEIIDGCCPRDVAHRP